MTDKLFAVRSSTGLINYCFVNGSQNNTPALFKKKSDAHDFLMKVRTVAKEIAPKYSKAMDYKIVQIQITDLDGKSLY